MKSNLLYIVIAVIIALFVYRELDNRATIHDYRSRLETCDDLYNNLLRASVQTDTVYNTKTVYVPKIVYKRAIDSFIDTIYITDNYTRVYTDTTETSDMRLYSESVVSGRLISNTFSYDLMIPREVIRQKIVYKDVPQDVIQKWAFFAGGSTGLVNHQLMLTAGATYNNVGLTYSYDIFNNNHLVGAVYSIRR